MGERQAPFVAVRTDIRKEERVLVIADIAGYSRHEAMGRLIDMWAWCADRKLEDAPEDCEGYAVSDAVVCRFLGPLGVEAILGGHCDEFALGERRDDDLIYLRGTSDTVSRLRAHRNSASAGGKARAATTDVTRRGGRFVGKRTKPPAARALSTSCEGAVDQPATSQPPAVTSEIPDPRSKKDPPPAHAIPPSTEYDADSALKARRARRAELWTELEQARAGVAAELGIEARPLPVQDPGERELSSLLAASADLERITVDVRHAIAMAVAEARRDRSVQWLSGGMFGERPFRRLVAMTEADASKPRDGPKRSGPTKPPERPNPIKPWT